MSDDDLVGSVAEEAARLFDALQDWAAQSGVAHAQATGAVADAAAGGLRDLGEHIATGAEECRYCPVCRGIEAVRSTSPEVRAHLKAAGSSLAHAVSALLESPRPSDRAGSDVGGVEHIRLDDED